MKSFHHSPNARVACFWQLADWHAYRQAPNEEGITRVEEKKYHKCEVFPPYRAQCGNQCLLTSMVTWFALVDGSNSYAKYTEFFF